MTPNGVSPAYSSNTASAYGTHRFSPPTTSLNTAPIKILNPQVVKDESVGLRKIQIPYTNREKVSSNGIDLQGQTKVDK